MIRGTKSGRFIRYRFGGAAGDPKTGEVSRIRQLARKSGERGKSLLGKSLLSHHLPVCFTLIG